MSKTDTEQQVLRENMRQMQAQGVQPKAFCEQVKEQAQGQLETTREGIEAYENILEGLSMVATGVSTLLNQRIDGLEQSASELENVIKQADAELALIKKDAELQKKKGGNFSPGSTSH